MPPRGETHARGAQTPPKVGVTLAHRARAGSDEARGLARGCFRRNVAPSGCQVTIAHNFACPVSGSKPRAFGGLCTVLCQRPLTPCCDAAEADGEKCHPPITRRLLDSTKASGSSPRASAPLLESATSEQDLSGEGEDALAEESPPPVTPDRAANHGVRQARQSPSGRLTIVGASSSLDPPTLPYPPGRDFERELSEERELRCGAYTSHHPP